MNGFFPNLDVTTIEAVQRRARRYATAVILMISVCLIYMALSFAFIYSLYKSDAEICESRQVSRVAIREAFSADPDWTVARQAAMDLNLPPKVPC